MLITLQHRKQTSHKRENARNYESVYAEEIVSAHINNMYHINIRRYVHITMGPFSRAILGVGTRVGIFLH